MAIRKNTPNYLRKINQPFTVLLNKTLDLIPDAAVIGIYVYLSSKDSNWEIQEKDLMNRFNVGRDCIRSKMKVLKELGLLIKESVRDAKGKIVHWETTLLNEIAEKPLSSIHIPEKPSSGLSTFLKNQVPGKTRHLDNPTHINKRYIPIKENKEIKDISSLSFSLDSENNYAGTQVLNPSSCDVQEVNVQVEEKIHSRFSYENAEASFEVKPLVELVEPKAAVAQALAVKQQVVVRDGGSVLATIQPQEKAIIEEILFKNIDNTANYTKSDYNNNQTYQEVRISDKNEMVTQNLAQHDVDNALRDNIFQIPKTLKLKNSSLSLEEILVDNSHHIDEQMILDWLQVRKAKRSPVTLTAWKRINKNLTEIADRARVPAKDAFEEMVTRGWLSVELKFFINKDETTRNGKPKQDVSCIM